VKRAELIERLADAIEEGRARRVAIDGPDAAGKTTLADELARALRARGREVTRVSADDFLRPREERYRRGELSPEGYYEDSFDHDALRAALAHSAGIAIVDGIFLLRPELRAEWDYRVFVSISFDEVLRRALDRDVALFGSRHEVERRYLTRYIPGQQLYLARARPVDAADVLVVNDAPESPSLLFAGATKH
jgi:uridine kinase